MLRNHWYSPGWLGPWLFPSSSCSNFEGNFRLLVRLPRLLTQLEVGLFVLYRICMQAGRSQTIIVLQFFHCSLKSSNNQKLPKHTWTKIIGYKIREKTLTKHRITTLAKCTVKHAAQNFHLFSNSTSTSFILTSGVISSSEIETFALYDHQIIESQ